MVRNPSYSKKLGCVHTPHHEADHGSDGSQLLYRQMVVKNK